MNSRALTAWLSSAQKDMPDVTIEKTDMEDRFAYIVSRAPKNSPSHHVRMISIDDIYCADSESGKANKLCF